MWAAAIVLLSELTLSGQPQPPPPRDSSTRTHSETATIRGRVVAADSGEPLRNARVALAGTGSIPPAFTSSDGRFVFAGLTDGRYTLSARKAGYVATAFGQRQFDQPPVPIDVDATTRIQDVEIRMARSATIAGRITDEFGEPIELATVVASRLVRRDAFTIARTVATAVTDDLGEYRLGGLPSGTYVVAATSAKRGSPVLIPTNPDQPPGPGQTRAYYPGVPARVQAQAIVVAAAEEHGGADFAITPARLPTLSISFTDLKGEPVNAVALLAYVGPYLVPAQAPIVPLMGPDAAPTLEPGDWSIFARAPGGFAGIARVSLGANDTSVTIRLGKGGQVSGRVVTENGPLPADTPFIVEATTDLSSPIGFVAPLSGGASARVDGSAPFELTELVGPRQLRARPATAGRWFVSAVVYQGRNIVDEPVDFRGGETLTDVQIVVSDQGGSVKGSAVGADGNPLRDYFVAVVPAEAGSLARLRRLARAARSNQKGEFTIENVPPGRYLAAAIEDIGDMDRPTLEFAEQLRARATPFSVAAREAVTVTLKLAP
jgi:protocatechuate 3,4-dioxygenase beta subunit